MAFLDGPKGAFILIDYVVSVLAIIGNLVALDSILHVHFGLTGYRRFLISLICSDLYISLVHVATFCLPLASALFDKCSAHLVRILQIVGFIANLLNLCGMSVDHYIGILHPLRYQDYMSKRMTCAIIILIWVVAFTLGFVDIFFAAGLHVLGLIWPQINSAKVLEANNGSLPVPTERSSLESQSVLRMNVSQSLLTSLMTIFNTNRDAPSDFLQINVFTTALPPDAYRNDISRSVFIPPYAKIAAASSNSGNRLRVSKKDQEEASDMFETSSFPNPQLLIMEPGSPGYADPGLGANQQDIFDKLSPEIENFLQAIIMNGNDSAMNPSVDSMMMDSDTGILSILGDEQSDSSTSWCAARNESVWLEFCVMTLTIFCFIFLIACYGRIFKEVLFSNYGQSERNMRRLVLTTMLLLGSFMLCWIPFMAFEFTMIIVLHTNFNVNDKSTLTSSASFFALHNAFNTLLMCSPLFDPIIYAARMRVIRQNVLFRYGRFFPFCRPCIDRVRERTRKNSFVPYAVSACRLSRCDDLYSTPCGTSCNFGSGDQLPTPRAPGNQIPVSENGGMAGKNKQTNTPKESKKLNIGPYQQNPRTHFQQTSSYKRRGGGATENNNSVTIEDIAMIKSSCSLLSSNYGSTSTIENNNANQQNEQENQRPFAPSIMHKWALLRNLFRSIRPSIKADAQASQEKCLENLISKNEAQSVEEHNLMLLNSPSIDIENGDEEETPFRFEIGGRPVDCSEISEDFCLIVVQPPSSTLNRQSESSANSSSFDILNDLSDIDSVSVFIDDSSCLTSRIIKPPSSLPISESSGDQMLFPPPLPFTTTQAVIDKFYENSARLFGGEEVMINLLADDGDDESASNITTMLEDYGNQAHLTRMTSIGQQSIALRNAFERMAAILWNNHQNLRLSKSLAAFGNYRTKSASSNGIDAISLQASYGNSTTPQIVIWQ